MGHSNSKQKGNNRPKLTIEDVIKESNHLLQEQARKKYTKNQIPSPCNHAAKPNKPNLAIHIHTNSDNTIIYHQSTSINMLDHDCHNHSSSESQNYDLNYVNEYSANSSKDSDHDSFIYPVESPIPQAVTDYNPDDSLVVSQLDSSKTETHIIHEIKINSRANPYKSDPYKANFTPTSKGHSNENSMMILYDNENQKQTPNPFALAKTSTLEPITALPQSSPFLTEGNTFSNPSYSANQTSSNMQEEGPIDNPGLFDSTNSTVTEIKKNNKKQKSKKSRIRAFTMPSNISISNSGNKGIMMHNNKGRGSTILQSVTTMVNFDGMDLEEEKNELPVIIMESTQSGHSHLFKQQSMENNNNDKRKNKRSSILPILMDSGHSVYVCDSVKRMVRALRWYSKYNNNPEQLYWKLVKTGYDKIILNDYQHILDQHLNNNNIDGDINVQYEDIRDLVYEQIEHCDVNKCDGMKRFLSTKNATNNVDMTELKDRISFYTHSMDLIHCYLLHLEHLY